MNTIEELVEEDVDERAEKIFVIELARREEELKRLLQVDKIRYVLNRAVKTAQSGPFAHLKSIAYDRVRIKRSVIMGRYFQKMRLQWLGAAGRCVAELKSINAGFNSKASAPKLVIPAPPSLLLKAPPLGLLLAGPSSKALNFNDPKPPANVALVKVPVSQIAPNAFNASFFHVNAKEIVKAKDEIKIDWQRVAEEFAETKKKEEKKAEKKESRQTEGIVETTKVNQYEIILSRYSIGIDETVSRIRDMSLSYDQLTTIARLVTDDDDCRKIADWQGDESTLVSAILAIRKLLQLPMLKARVRCLTAKHDLMLDIKQLTDAMREYRDAFECIYVGSRD